LIRMLWVIQRSRGYTEKDDTVVLASSAQGYVSRLGLWVN